MHPSLYLRGRNQNTLELSHAAQILEWYRRFEDIEGHAKVVTLEEIAANDWNLNIPRYVEPVIEEETVSVEEALKQLQQALEEAYAAENRLNGITGKRWIIGEFIDAYQCI